MRSLMSLIVLSLLARTASGQTVAQAPLRFEVTRLTGPGSCDAPIPTAINDDGRVTLICTFGNQTRSFVWNKGVTVALGQFGAGFIRHEANDLNRSGQVAGSSWGAGFPAAAWEWSDGKFTPLGALGGSNATSVAINESGQQTGWAHTAPPIGSLIGFAYLFDGGAMINLGELPEAILSSGSGINDLGQVAGISMALGENFFRGVIADTTIGMHSVGTLGGLESHAQALNDAGQVVGRSETGQIVEGRRAYHAFVWQDGVMTALRPLRGGRYSGATGINAAGDVVGWSKADYLGVESQAVLWRDGEPIDLNARIHPRSGWVLETTWDINEAGQIVGTGRLDGAPATFLLTPTVEQARGRAADLAALSRGQPSNPPSSVRTRPVRPYKVIDLGVLPGGKEGWAFGLNDAGQVASTAQYDSSRRFYHAVLWELGVARDLGQLSIGGFHSFATAVNDAGHVVGGSLEDVFFNRVDRAFLHDGTQMVDLGALASNSTSFAFDINDRGDVVGYSGTGAIFDGNSVLHAVLWSQGEITDLGTLGGLYSRAHAVNDGLSIVGASLIDDGPLHAFAWSGSMVDLGTLGGASSEAWDVSEHGWIVGFAENADGVRRAFLFREGVMRDLGALPGARASEAHGIEDSGRIVGSSWVPGDGPHAVLWDHGQVIDLNDAIQPDRAWKLQDARAINEAGEIVGHGRLAGRTRGFLLVPLGG